MNDRTGALIAGAAIWAGVACVSTAVQAASLSDTDRHFLVDTAQGATYELAVAKLALTKDTTADIRSYARTMIAAHQDLNPRLHRVAQRNHVRLPTGMTSDKRQSLDRLGTLDGKSFDAAFVRDEADDNENDMASESKEIGTTDNAQVKELVEQMKAADTRHAAIGKTLEQAGQ